MVLVVEIRRHQHDGQVGVTLLRFHVQVVAVQVGHDDVAQHHIERVWLQRTAVEDFQRFEAIRSDFDRAALLSQQVAQRVAHAEIVIDDQQPQAGQRPGGRARPDGPLGHDVVPPQVGHARAVQIFGRVVTPAMRHVVDTRDDAADLGELALDGLHPFFLDDVLLIGKALGHVLGQNVQVVEDHLEGVVDAMPETDRQLAQRRKLVPPTNLAQVLQKSDRAGLAPIVVVNDGRRNRGRNMLPTLGDQRRLEVLDLALLADLFAAHRVHHAPRLFEAGVNRRPHPRPVDLL